jgi:hypothetical protein
VSHGVSADVVAIAETLNLCLPDAPGAERLVTPGWAAFVGVEVERHYNVVQRFRLAPDEVAPAVAELRALFRARGRQEVTWEVGPASTPSDLVERLLALGMTPDDEPVVAGMVLSCPLPETASDVTPDLTVQPITDFAGFRERFRIYRRCFGVGRPAATEDEIRADFERRIGREEHVRRYLAFSGGEAVAAADAIFVERAVALAGGATLPEARGKGAYRALLAARFRDAVARGTPVLVVQAGAMSRPILERLGFKTVARVRILVDRLV